jgi:hypothetical protein
LWLTTGTIESLKSTSENIWIQLALGNARAFLPEMQEAYNEKKKWR